MAAAGVVGRPGVAAAGGDDVKAGARRGANWPAGDPGVVAMVLLGVPVHGRRCRSMGPALRGVSKCRVAEGRHAGVGGRVAEGRDAGVGGRVAEGRDAGAGGRAPDERAAGEELETG